IRRHSDPGHPGPPQPLQTAELAMLDRTEKAADASPLPGRHALEDLVLDVVLVQDDAGRAGEAEAAELAALELHDVELLGCDQRGDGLLHGRGAVLPHV